MKGKVAAVLILVAIIATNVFFWNSIYSKDVQTNYNVGMQQGTTIGYNNGRHNGLEEGYNKGYDAGVVKGNQTGYQKGLDDGKTIGYSEGHSQGYNEGNISGFMLGLNDGMGTKYNIRDPKYQEMLNFIASDKTDEHSYNEDTYNCYDFTNAVANNAFNAGYRCGDVYIDFPDGAHALIAFNTTDRGLIFIEPQTDAIMKLVVGQPYYDRAVYEAPDFDDTIVRYGIIW